MCGTNTKAKSEIIKHKKDQKIVHSKLPIYGFQTIGRKGKATLIGSFFFRKTKSSHYKKCKCPAPAVII